ncbi:MAG: PorT family protein [Muribaculaceae bacterium]|nr:PorT family protein [Muribaculaceae bacterium]
MTNRFLLSCSLAALASTAMAADFFSTAEPASLFDIAVRFGLNTSNRTIAKKTFDNWNCNSWGTGIDLGATADINFRDWFSVQPGFFFQSRSGNYAYSTTIIESEDVISSLDQFGHIRSYNFTIPVLAAAHFNLTDDVRWNVEFGPYIQFGLHNSIDKNLLFLDGNIPHFPYESPDQWEHAKMRSFDFGFKFGTGLTILKHYDVAVHYEAGALDVWKISKLGGRNKAWIFSVGYKF